VTTRDLHSVIQDRINVRWSDWATRHPHLAAAIDRTMLVESTTALLREDPDYIEAMRSADLDEARLVMAANILERANTIIQEALPL